MMALGEFTSEARLLVFSFSPGIVLIVFYFNVDMPFIWGLKRTEGCYLTLINIIPKIGFRVRFETWPS
jgi:hypothetical protein